MKYFNVLRSVLIGAPIGITYFDSVGYVARVEGVSMQPTLNPKRNTAQDLIYLDRLAIRNCNVSRGEIVSFISPKNPSERLLKRVVGLEGDVVYTKRYRKPMVRIPKGHCWVEGDNSERSMDSNEFGPISLGLLTAKASYVVWPPSRWQRLVEKDMKVVIY